MSIQVLTNIVYMVVNLHSKFTTMYTRLLTNPNYSFFLFGPRGTGKTTWLRTHYPGALWKNLLLDADYLPLLSNPACLAAEVLALPPASWVVVDEVQKVPALLNEIHNLISLHGSHYLFAMSGSSARKLRRLDVNLLAGRAIERQFFPLNSAEMAADYDLNEALRVGTLPSVVQTPSMAVDILNAYVGTYLKQEIQQETLISDVAGFHRFLKIAAIMNGQVLNVSSIARDAAVARSTVERYFEILVDTLIGFRLPGWQPRMKVREKVTPKFYFFDPGVVRAISGTIYTKVGDLEVGGLLETVVLHELRSAIAYQNIGGELFYWRTSGGLEVDFIWHRGNEVVAIEVKNSQTWRREYGKALHALQGYREGVKAYGVYRGDKVLKVPAGEVLPVEEFFRRLHAGAVLGGG